MWVPACSLVTRMPAEPVRPSAAAFWASWRRCSRYEKPGGTWPGWIGAPA